MQFFAVASAVSVGVCKFALAARLRYQTFFANHFAIGQLLPMGWATTSSTSPLTNANLSSRFVLLNGSLTVLCRFEANRNQLILC